MRRTIIAESALALALLTGCNGGGMLKKGDQAPPFATADHGRVQVEAGSDLTLDELRSQGPVFLVFLRGFS